MTCQTASTGKGGWDDTESHWCIQGGEIGWRQVSQSQQQAESQYESEGGGDTDVPASQLADKDSLFIQCNGLNVHYKQAYPAKVSNNSRRLTFSPPMRAISCLAICPALLQLHVYFLATLLQSSNMLPKWALLHCKDAACTLCVPEV